MTLITNVPGTSDLTCTCGTWKQHWINFSGHSTSHCSVIGCQGEFEVGSHVRFVEPRDKKVYILPLCKDCNQRTGILEVLNVINPVSADPSETCGRT